ncbi:MAG: hypothetical protein V4628_05240 [Pseudomonadota bacterium]
MRRVIDRIVAEDADGRLYTVMCIQEYVPENDLGTAIREIGLTYQTTLGELLTTSDNVSFNIAGTNHFLHKVIVARKPEGRLFRDFPRGAVPIY